METPSKLQVRGHPKPANLKNTADRYVKDSYNALPRKEQIKNVAQLNLATRVDMVVLCLLSWYDNMTLERKVSFGQTGPEVP